MAQDFRRYAAKVTAANTASTLFTADSNDTIVGIHCANVAGTAINVDVYISSGGSDHYLVKDAPVPIGSSLSVDGKFVVQTGDALKVETDTANSLDVWTSVVDAISA